MSYFHKNNSTCNEYSNNIVGVTNFLIAFYIFDMKDFIK